MSRKIAALFLLAVSCAHSPAVRFVDDSGKEKTLWMCRPDAKHPGDIECIDLRTLIRGGDMQIQINEDGSAQMGPALSDPHPNGRTDM
jgi:hypothetical protein